MNADIPLAPTAGDTSIANGILAIMPVRENRVFIEFGLGGVQASQGKFGELTGTKTGTKN